MFDYIHIDEKWFYMTKVKKKTYYLVPDEEPPERAVKAQTLSKK